MALIKIFFRALHMLPEEARKLLAGLCMLIAGVAFFGVWTSFISSRLVVLAPSPASPLGEAGAGSQAPLAVAPMPGFRAPATGGDGAASPPEATSPAAGIAETFRSLQKSVSGGSGIGQMHAPAAAGEKVPEVRGFFASVAHGAYAMIVGIGAGAETAAALLYRALARYVPPNL